MLLFLSHVLAVVAVYATMMPPAATLALLVLILLSLFYCLARDALLLLPGSWCEISFDQYHVSVVTRGGSGFSGEVTNGTAVSPYFAVLHVRREGHRLPVYRVIFPDALGEDEFRKLRVCLRYAQKPP